MIYLCSRSQSIGRIMKGESKAQNKVESSLHLQQIQCHVSCRENNSVDELHKRFLCVIGKKRAWTHGMRSHRLWKQNNRIMSFKTAKTQWLITPEKSPFCRTSLSWHQRGWYTAERMWYHQLMMRNSKPSWLLAVSHHKLMISNSYWRNMSRSWFRVEIHYHLQRTEKFATSTKMSMNLFSNGLDACLSDIWLNCTNCWRNCWRKIHFVLTDSVGLTNCNCSKEEWRGHTFVHWLHNVQCCDGGYGICDALGGRFTYRTGRI